MYSTVFSCLDHQNREIVNSGSQYSSNATKFMSLHGWEYMASCKPDTIMKGGVRNLVFDRKE
jgi:hypothetical protein